MSASLKVHYTSGVEGDGGWPGDVAKVKLDDFKAYKHGWRRNDIAAAKTIDVLIS